MCNALSRIWVRFLLPQQAAHNYLQPQLQGRQGSILDSVETVLTCMCIPIHTFLNYNTEQSYFVESSILTCTLNEHLQNLYASKSGMVRSEVKEDPQKWRVMLMEWKLQHGNSVWCIRLQLTSTPHTLWVAIAGKFIPNCTWIGWSSELAKPTLTRMKWQKWPAMKACYILKSTRDWWMDVNTKEWNRTEGGHRPTQICTKAT